MGRALVEPTQGPGRGAAMVREGAAGAAGAAHSEDRRNAAYAYLSFAALKAGLECWPTPAVLPLGEAETGALLRGELEVSWATE